jgi:WD40 repeat protein/pimeloyl-ACP methyl ester carboxylesterase
MQFDRLRKTRQHSSSYQSTRKPGYGAEDDAHDGEVAAEEAQQSSRPVPLRQSYTERSAISSFDVPFRDGRPSAAGNKAKERSRDRRLDPLGLTVLYEPEGSPSADLVFIHGLGGSSRQTWSKNRDPALFWPLEWLPHEAVLSSARVSTFGYNAYFAQTGKGNILNISDFAKELLFSLRFATGAEQRGLEMGSVPIILIAHSMGGLVAKKAYILGQNDVHYKDIVQSISAIIFLSTPHRGTDLAETLNKILSACLFAFSPKQYIEELRRNSDTLQEINDQFRNFAANMDIVSFFETQPTSVGLSSLLILQRDSSTLGYPEEITKPLDADHHDVCKYPNRQHSNYTSVRDVLIYLVEKLLPTSVHQSLENSSEDLDRIAAVLGEPEMPLDDREYFSDKRLDGSCEWVLDDPNFSAWLNDDGLHSHVLWCTGKPGSGKSVTTSFVIAYLEEIEVKHAFYFFRFGDQVKNNLTALLLSLALQIATAVPEYRRRLKRLFEDGLNVQRAAPRLIWQKLFVNALLKLDVKHPIYIVIDALDECDSAPLLLKFMLDTATCSVPIRFLLVSRAVLLIAGPLERLSKTVTVSRTSLDDCDDDLRLYVDEEMQSMRGDDFFKGRIVARILEKAGGNFLWVHLVVNQILDCHTEDDVEEALNQVPQELEPLYERMDAELAARSKPNDQKLGLTILRWASCSRHPLTLSELTQALQPEYPRVLDLRHTVRQVCGEFVIVDKKERVTMMHSSAREYLTSIDHLNYFVHVAVSHQMLFTKCMVTLASTGTKLQLGLSRDRSFTLYAATSWPFHLSHSEASFDNETLITIASFFRTSSVLSWIHTLSTHGRLRTLVQASKSLTDFLRKSDKLDKERSPLTHRLREKEDVLLWAHDLTRIVGKFGSQLVQHPKTIYTLVPAFCPQQSIMHKQFASRLSMSSLTIKGIRKPYWDDCLAKFAVSSQVLPVKIMTLDRYFAILDAEGCIRLHYSATSEEARTFRHAERVLTMCFSPTGEKMATYGLQRTKIWDVRTGKLRGSIQNPEHAKALAISFADDDEVVLTCSDDCEIRSCLLGGLDDGWSVIDNVIGAETLHGQQANSPRRAQFSHDGSLIAVAYRGLPLSVWSVADSSPRPIGRCERAGNMTAVSRAMQTNFTDAQAFCWNPMTNHILGVFNDGCVFKWSPLDNDYSISKIRATHIECSVDGKFFVTSSNSGTLSIWEFYHFVPIYQLSYSASVTDLAIDCNEARIYDLRDKFCNIWEPSALLRLLESEEKTSDSGSTRESSTQATMISDASVEDSDPITSLAVSTSGTRYTIGDDEGNLCLYSITGSRMAEVARRFMTIEHISWSLDSEILASSDLSRSVLVQRLPNSSATNRLPAVTTIFTSDQREPILQLLLSPKGDYLLIQTTKSTKMFSVEKGAEVHSFTLESNFRWANHPGNPGVFLGFGQYTITIHNWGSVEPLHRITLQHDDVEANENATPREAQQRRPSGSYPMAPSEIETKVTKVLFPVEGSLTLIELSHATHQYMRSKQYMLADVFSILPGQEVIIAEALPAELRLEIELPLGFIASKYLNTTTRRKSSSYSSGALGIPQLNNSATRRKSSSYSAGALGIPQLNDTATRRKSSSYSPGALTIPQLDIPDSEQTLVFVSKDFWICTYTIGAGAPSRIKKYFFLPRDWLNTDWLELATITADGKLLYPRNGEVAIIDGWLSEEWSDTDDALF